MKKLYFLLMAVIVALLFVGCSSGTTSTNNTSVNSSKELTVKEAEKLVKAWAENSKATKNSVIKVETDPTDNTVTIDGKMYYTFRVEGIHETRLIDILVDPQTRALLLRGSNLQPMDEWHQDYRYQQAEGIRNKNIEKKRMETLDKRLIGKWRSVEFDGTSPTVEFFANGTVLNHTNLWPRGTQKFATNDGIITLENGQRFEYKTDGSGRAAINDANGNTLLLMRTKL